MSDWIAKLNGFLSLNDRDILNHAGTISHEMAKAFADAEYEQFNAARITDVDRLDSDFDRAVKQLPKPARKKKDS